jgi:hypothetical protein
VHWKAVKHVFCYLRGTVELKLMYGPGDVKGEERFLTYCDADHGGDIDRRKSTSGYMVKVGSGVVGWSSKLQPCCNIVNNGSRICGRSVSRQRNMLDAAAITGDWIHISCTIHTIH